jgi:MFS family permease
MDFLSSRLYHYIPSYLGLAYLAIAVPPFFIAPISGWLSDTRGPKLPGVLGMTMVIPFLLLLRIPSGEGTPDASQVALLCILVVFVSNSSSNQR